MPNLALYTHAEITPYSHELLVNGRPVAVIHALPDATWEFPLGCFVRSGFSSYMEAYRQACWLHKHITNPASTLLAA
jgi:hypothetical protein